MFERMEIGQYTLITARKALDPLHKFASLEDVAHRASKKAGKKNWHQEMDKFKPKNLAAKDSHLWEAAKGSAAAQKGYSDHAKHPAGKHWTEHLKPHLDSTKSVRDQLTPARKKAFEKNVYTKEAGTGEKKSDVVRKTGKVLQHKKAGQQLRRAGERASQRPKGDWFHRLSKTAQQEYLQTHKRSKLHPGSQQKLAAEFAEMAIGSTVVYTY